ncbi:ankyrin repeat and protein kinase domain-containing protein 1 [Ilyonectria robusta]
MDTSSLIPMVGDGPNRFLVESISRINSQILGIQQREFHTALGSEGDSEVFCFYETLESPTVHQDEHGNWRMTGATAVLVTKSSATHCRPWESGPEHICAIARTHSDMVKFRPQDHEYDNARETIKGLVQRALSGRRRFQTSQTNLVVRNNGDPHVAGRYQTPGSSKRQLSFGNGQESYGVAPNQMDISSWQNHGESNSSRPPKRHRAFPNDFVNMIHEPQNGTPASHGRYTIAWICALSIEMAAALAMLDECHDDLPVCPDDNNIYKLGSIKHHNIVITQFPTAQYRANVASVLSQLTCSFPSTRLALIVGIGGGVPNRLADIRLGDIVVGTRVMQYDTGKILGDEQTQFPATTTRVIHQTAMSLVSNLRSEQEFGFSRVPSILRTKLGERSRFSRPSSQDRLFSAAYEHANPTLGCEGCEYSKLVPRSNRNPDDPVVHYGGIASGNQVMCNGSIRDTVARKLDVIGFGMETAGLVDLLPCLPILGTGDYADSHRNMEWQNYAAAAAAAYARELLEALPLRQTHAQAKNVLDPRKLLPWSSRLSSHRDLRPVNRESYPEYQAWLDPSKLTQHHGFLWIRGNPGAGKSTIMKFLYLNMKRKSRRKDAITASFFFNARGEYLEKSMPGMYRSLVLQLLEGYPDLQTILDDDDLVSRRHDFCPSLNVLKGIFSNAVSCLGRRSFTCFVDALDECDEQQVVDMVQYFEELAEQSTNDGIQLRICFSSRHYPHIDIQSGIPLTLEDQSAHTRDLETYISSRLRIKDPALIEELRPQLLEKAAGVFLWVVLVVKILNEENRNGRLALRKRLQEIPSGLSELFNDILTRDEENMEHLRLCILWILYAKRPLRQEEYYHALWSGLSPEGLVDPEIPDLTASDATDRVKAFVISSSKGLAEITKSKQPTVQFIHESVSDFLVKDKGLQELWPDLGLDGVIQSHERLKQCCHTYMMRHPVRMCIATVHGRNEILKKYPFLEYASQQVLYHADAAVGAGDAISQQSFLSHFPIPYWISIANLFEKFKVRHYSLDASLLYILAERGFSRLIRTLLKEDPRIHFLGERYRYPLFAALANGQKETFAALLGLPSNIHNGVDITEGLTYRKDISGFENSTALSWAAQNGRTAIVELLLQKESAINQVDEGGHQPLAGAAGGGHEAIVRLLIDKGAYINGLDGYYHTPLSRAVGGGHEAIVRLLIDKGADINAPDGLSYAPLPMAAAGGHEAIVRLLIDKGADINAPDGLSYTPLPMAAAGGHEAIARLLIDKGADINARDRLSYAPLLMAAEGGHEAIARLLIDKGADINARGGSDDTPLLMAAEGGHEAIARLLIDKGADINARGEFNNTPLLKAAEGSHEAIVKLLIDKGADVNACGRYNRTPLLMASEGGHEAIVKLLVDKGADINARGRYNRTPLLMATEGGHEAVAKLLVDKGANK